MKALNKNLKQLFSLHIVANTSQGNNICPQTEYYVVSTSFTHFNHTRFEVYVNMWIVRVCVCVRVCSRYIYIYVYGSLYNTSLMLQAL